MKHNRFSYQIVSLNPLRVASDAGAKGFRGEITRHCSKVYVISSGQNIVYVGSSRQPILRRLSGALRATGVGGYYGYAWKSSADPLRIDVWIFPEITGQKGKRCLEAETVEAELVYLVRQIQGNWPQHQTEIHFHQSTEQHRQVARTIFDAVRRGGASILQS